MSISYLDPKKAVPKSKGRWIKEKKTSGEKKSYKNPFKRNKIPNQKQNK